MNVGAPRLWGGRGIWSAAARRRCGAGRGRGWWSVSVAPASRRRLAPVVAGHRRRHAGATAKVDARGELAGKASVTGHACVLTPSLPARRPPQSGGKPPHSITLLGALMLLGFAVPAAAGDA